MGDLYELRGHIKHLHENQHLEGLTGVYDWKSRALNRWQDTRCFSQPSYRHLTTSASVLEQTRTRSARHTPIGVRKPGVSSILNLPCNLTGALSLRYVLMWVGPDRQEPVFETDDISQCILWISRQTENNAEFSENDYNVIDRDLDADIPRATSFL